MCKLKLKGERLSAACQAPGSYCIFAFMASVFGLLFSNLGIIELFLKPYAFTLLSPEIQWTCCNLATSDNGR